jgi:hypothetical protein
VNRLIETTPNSKIEIEAAQLTKAVRTIREMVFGTHLPLRRLDRTILRRRAPVKCPFKTNWRMSASHSSRSSVFLRGTNFLESATRINKPCSPKVRRAYYKKFTCSHATKPFSTPAKFSKAIVSITITDSRCLVLSCPANCPRPAKKFQNGKIRIVHYPRVGLLLNKPINLVIRYSASPIIAPPYCTCV